MTEIGTTDRHSGRRKAALGAYGERLAERHLKGLGLLVIERNWRCPRGEIDLVLRDGDVLVVCEVKTRRDDSCGHPLEAIGPAKTDRLHALAALWQEERGVHPPEVRLDAVGILVPRRGAPLIEHVRGIG